MKIAKAELHHAEYELEFDWEITRKIVICPTFTITATIDIEDELEESIDITFQNGVYEQTEEKGLLEPEADTIPICFMDFEDCDDARKDMEKLACKLLKERFRDELLQLEMLNADLSDRQKRNALDFSDKRSIANLAQTIKIMKDNLDD